MGAAWASRNSRPAGRAAGRRRDRAQQGWRGAGVLELLRTPRAQAGLPARPVICPSLKDCALGSRIPQEARDAPSPGQDLLPRAGLQPWLPPYGGYRLARLCVLQPAGLPPGRLMGATRAVWPAVRLTPDARSPSAPCQALPWCVAQAPAQGLGCPGRGPHLLRGGRGGRKRGDGRQGCGCGGLQGARPGLGLWLLGSVREHVERGRGARCPAPNAPSVGPPQTAPLNQWHPSGWWGPCGQCTTCPPTTAQVHPRCLPGALAGARS